MESPASQDDLEQDGTKVEVVVEESARAYSLFGIKPKGVLKRSRSFVDDNGRVAKVRR